MSDASTPNRATQPDKEVSAAQQAQLHAPLMQVEVLF